MNSLKTLSLSLVALALGGCAFTVREDRRPSPNVSVSGGIPVGPTGPSTRSYEGIPIGAVITNFQASRDTYFVGDSIDFTIDVTRPGYVTLVIYNPEGELLDPNLHDIPVEAGRNRIPRNVRLSAAPPRGTSCVLALYTPRITGGRVIFRGQYSTSIVGTLRIYFDPFDIPSRDVAQLCVRVV